MGIIKFIVVDSHPAFNYTFQFYPRLIAATSFMSCVPVFESIPEDLQSDLVRHYLIEVVEKPTKGVRLRGFPSEPVFPSLAALISRHTQDALALPCRLILPPVPTTPLPPGYVMPPLIVLGSPQHSDRLVNNHTNKFDDATPQSTGSVIGATSDIGSNMMDGTETDGRRSITGSSAVMTAEPGATSPQVLPFECVIKDDQRRSAVSPNLLNQGMSEFHTLL